MTARQRIELITPHYLLRTLEPADATEGWTQWLTDPETARMLNAQERAATLDEIRAYIASFDSYKRHLLGIFARGSNALIGIRAVYIDWARREFTVNVLVGEREQRGKGAREETRAVMYRHFFEVLGLQAALCSVLAHNAAILRVMEKGGWELTGTTSKAAALGGAPYEVLSYRLSRETWVRLGKS